MAIFDFPRIHFSGNLDVNVPTINNAFYFPLTMYDAVRSEAFLPPRLYFHSVDEIESVTPSIQPKPQYDDVNKLWYIEISPVEEIPVLRTWCMTPLGQNPTAPDAAYVPYYKKAEEVWADTYGTTLIGSAPGYWNMYGDMGVYMSDVHVTGVQTFDGSTVHTYNKSSKNIPNDVLPFLNASFDLDTAPATGITTASMVETVSNQSCYASVFCSNVNLFNSQNTDDVLLQGTPFRFSALIYSAWRVLNWWPPMAGSGRFCSAIPMEEISQQEQSALVQFFNANKAYDSRKLKGVFVTFVILEVFENRYNQNVYEENGTASNPALATTVGSITPWYEGDMKTGILGRNLISLNMKPVYNGLPLTAAIASVNVLENGSAVVSVDMGNTWPEEMTPPYNPKPPNEFKPVKRDQVTFTTMNIGRLSFRYGAEPTTEFAGLVVSEDSNSLKSVFEKGCVFDFVIKDPTVISAIENNLMQVFLDTSPEGQVLTESPYMMSSDQKGIYSNQGDPASLGYFSYNEVREPCRVRIFEKGKPVTKPIEVGIAEYIVPEASNDPTNGPDTVKWVLLKDNDVVELVASQLQLSNNAIYYFVYRDQYPNNAIPAFVLNNNYTVMDTGSFVVLRVHPTKDYSQYINPANWGTTPPDFSVVYEEVFKLYDVVYPIMALVHPFTPEVWENGTIAGLVLQRTDMSIWNDILYMPKSRELSASQRKLLEAWAAYISKDSK